MTVQCTEDSIQKIAIVGFSCRLPGASTPSAFWENLRSGKDVRRCLTDEELERAGVPLEERSRPNYVKSAYMMGGIDLFDAPFFGFTPREAELLDPHQRIFLECAWEALEQAGHTPETFPGRIGVFAGSGTSSYILNILSHPELAEIIGGSQTLIATSKDFLTANVSYKLNLTGPSVVVQSACSTSLVAICLGCQSLLDYESDMVLAGGISLRMPEETGYLYRDGMIFSPDGYCRAFDVNGKGTVASSGAGIVVLRRLADAINQGDCIRAVIIGSAINNDGSSRVGFAAPGVAGQAKVIAEAHAVAGVPADSITYVEAHGTGTSVGDPIEIAALTKAFRASTARKSFCAIGSVKTNIGHTDTAAGAAGLIKTALALEHKELPPCLHFEKPNPLIDFENSPVYVNAKLANWQSTGAPRRAGVSSFGMGGTNAHIVLEEAPEPKISARGRDWQILRLSARSSTAVQNLEKEFCDHLKKHPAIDLADVSYTLKVGRRPFDHRRVVLCSSVGQAIEILQTRDAQLTWTAAAQRQPLPIAFLFPGNPAKCIGIGAEIYESEPVFRDEFDGCARFLKSSFDLDLSAFLYQRNSLSSAPESWSESAALFATEYSLAKLWIFWGVKPEVLIGDRLGEYTAACLAGVFSLNEALRLVVERGRLLQHFGRCAPQESSLQRELDAALKTLLSASAADVPVVSVVADPGEHIGRLNELLEGEDVPSQRMGIDPALRLENIERPASGFLRCLTQMRPHPPSIPFFSSVTGTWIRDTDAVDPQYWVKHLFAGPRLSNGITELLKKKDRILLEVGPSDTVRFSAGLQPPYGPIVPSMRSSADGISEAAALQRAVGLLWLAGFDVDTLSFYAGEHRRRVPLPTYPFERRRYWIENFAAVPNQLLRQAPLPQAPTAVQDCSSDLRQNETPDNVPDTQYSMHSTGIELAIMQAWDAVLGVRGFSSTDNFFYLGGNSLLATGLLASLEKKLSVHIPMSKFFETPTVAGLAKLIEEELLAQIEMMPEDEVDKQL